MAKRAPDNLFPGRQGDELDAALDVHTACSQVLIQHRLGLGLRHEEQEWVRGVL